MTNIWQSPPPVFEVEKVFPEPIQKVALEKGVTFRYIQDSDFPTIKLSMKFPAGSWFESMKLLAVNAARLAKSGTSLKPSAILANEIDFTGGKILFSCYEDHAWVTISCLNNQFEKILSITTEILSDALFPEDEVDILKAQLLQKLKLNNKKTDYLAQKYFFSSFFGENHPYGYYSTEEAINALNSKALKEFFNKHYTSHGLEIIGVGNFGDTEFKLLNNFLSAIHPGQEKINPENQREADIQQTKIFPLKKSEQASVVLGCPALQRNHQDYIDYSILITLLGGYFGSRLMTNLRENKGLTYGIYAQIINYKYDSCLMIQADVNKTSAKATIDEIHYEIQKLKTEPVQVDELTNMKQYLSGVLLGILDGKQKQFQMLKQIVSYELEEDFLFQYFNAVKQIQPETIQKMADLYLSNHPFYEIIAGPEQL